MKRRGVSILLATVMLLSVCTTNLTVLAAGSEPVKLATLTIHYYLQNGNGNMIHEPYIAQQVVGSTYEVKSPEIENFKLVNDGQETISGTLTKDTVISVDYTYAEETFLYTVIYEGHLPDTDEPVTLDTVTGYAPEGTQVPVEYKEFFGYDKDSTDEMWLTVTADGKATKTLTYTLKDAPYVIFRTQGSYVEPISKDPGTDITEQIKNIEDPTRQGYQFKGWEYNGKTYDNAAALSADLNKMPATLTYVTAVWEPAEVNYTVLVWFENAEADDDGHYGYTLHSNGEIRQAVTGATVTANEQDKLNGNGSNEEEDDEFYGFDYSHCEKVTVSGDGKSVLNLYYDREMWTITLYESNYQTVYKTYTGKYGSRTPTDLLYIVYQAYYDRHKPSGASTETKFAYLKDGTSNNTGEYAVIVPTSFNIRKDLELYPHYTTQKLNVYHLYC
ncbi:hypothetical protein B5E56_10395 [Flavonifractor sp. An112]|uniref:MucBP domain-containing protein n=1 Tax=Flavonifractor sp. An112 TaxID=1965544 RepID=UPI000B369745|nr:MucBP domain-containing protein [Flavonifractor sp. An112]OUQ58669.1 hypothetical protein B5E56_10395 [Flavonifractor sp. An112]